MFPSLRELVLTLSQGPQPLSVGIHHGCVVGSTTTVTPTPERLLDAQPLLGQCPVALVYNSTKSCRASGRVSFLTSFFQPCGTPSWQHQPQLLIFMLTVFH